MHSDDSHKKVACIGGLSGGIGSALARILCEAGWSVHGYARTQGRWESIRSGLPSSVGFSVADAREEGAVESVVKDVVNKEGRLDAYVHAIGSILLKPAHTLSLAEWEETLRINLTSAFLSLKAVLPVLQRQGGGSIVFISTVAARIGLPSHEAIAAAKAGLEGLVRSAAATYANKNIRINAVAPGLVETPLARPVLGSDSARALSERMHPLGRIGRPEQVASLLAWLCQPEADWMTGQVLSLDGGMSSVLPRPRI